MLNYQFYEIQVTFELVSILILLLKPNKRGKLVELFGNNIHFYLLRGQVFWNGRSINLPKTKVIWLGPTTTIATHCKTQTWVEKASQSLNRARPKLGCAYQTEVHISALWSTSSLINGNSIFTLSKRWMGHYLRFSVLY